MDDIEQKNIDSELKDSNETSVPFDSFYFGGLVLYILYSLNGETKWNFPEFVVYWMKVISLLLLSANWVISLTKYKDSHQIILLFGALAVTVLVGSNAGFQKDENLLYEVLIAYLLVFGAINIDYQKIIKIYFKTGAIFCAITVSSSLLGIIENTLAVSDREEALGLSDSIDRYCLGYGWSTNMANHCLFILLAYVLYIRRCLNIKEIAIFFCIMNFVLLKTGSRMSFVCILLIILLSVLLNSGWGRRIITSRFACFLVIISIPFFAFVSYLATASYDETDLFWVGTDLLLTGRLHIGNEALVSTDITLWGQEYLMFGSAINDGFAYNYIDCSYLQLIVIYGLVFFCLMILAYVYISRQAYLRKDYIFMYVVLVAGISGMIAQHFIELYMNPLLIALFANHKNELTA